MKKLALLVIDVQNVLVHSKPFAIDEIIENIKNLIEVSRENNAEVIYVQHNGKVGSEIEPNSDGWQIYEKIKPNPNEKIFFKNYNSAFKETNLHEYLKSRDINDLIITGMQTDYCIDTTVKVAFECGFKLIIPEKTNTTFDNGNISEMIAKSLTPATILKVEVDEEKGEAKAYILPLERAKAIGKNGVNINLASNLI